MSLTKSYPITRRASANGVSKPNAKKPSVKRCSKRIPLRELSSEEVFQRDEASLEFLRRVALPSPRTANTKRAVVRTKATAPGSLQSELQRLRMMR
ncbi:hypothetical protein RUND412_010286 [Rhizina undulata]